MAAQEASPGKPSIMERISQLAPLPTTMEINKETGKPTPVHGMANEVIEISPRTQDKLQAAMEIEFSSRGLLLNPTPKTPPGAPQLPPDKDPSLEYYGTSPSKAEALVDTEVDAAAAAEEGAEYAPAVVAAAEVAPVEGAAAPEQLPEDEPLAVAAAEAEENANPAAAEEEVLSVQVESSVAVRVQGGSTAPAAAGAGEEAEAAAPASLEPEAAEKPVPVAQPDGNSVVESDAGAASSAGAETRIASEQPPQEPQPVPVVQHLPREAAQKNEVPPQQTVESPVLLAQETAQEPAVPAVQEEVVACGGVAEASPAASPEEQQVHSPSRGAALAESNDNVIAEAELVSAVVAAVVSAPRRAVMDDEDGDGDEDVYALAAPALSPSGNQAPAVATMKELPAVPVAALDVEQSGTSASAEFDVPPVSTRPLVMNSPVKTVEALKQQSQSPSVIAAPAGTVAHSPIVAAPPMGGMSSPETGPTERERERSLRLRNDAKQRRAAEIAARKLAEETRLNQTPADMAEALMISKKPPSIKKGKRGDPVPGAVAAPFQAPVREQPPAGAAPTGAAAKRSKYPLTAKRLAETEAVARSDSSLKTISEVAPTVGDAAAAAAAAVVATPIPPPMTDKASKLPSQRAKLARQKAAEDQLREGAALLKPQQGAEAAPPVSADQEVEAATTTSSSGKAGMKYVDDPTLNAVITDLINTKSPPRNLYPQLATKQPPVNSTKIPTKSKEGSPGPHHLGIGDGAKLPAVESVVAARVPAAPESMYDAHGRKRVRNAGLGKGGEKKEKNKKPLWKRMEEIGQAKAAEDAREKEAKYANYRINRARAQPTRDEIEEHKRVHDAIIEQQSWKRSAAGDNRRVNGGGVNIEPMDLQYNTNHQLAAAVLEKMEQMKATRKKPGAAAGGACDEVKSEKGIVDAFRKNYATGPERNNAATNLETSFTKMAKNEIEKKKFMRVMEEEEKKLRYEKKKMFSEQVRDTFLPSSGIAANNSDSGGAVYSSGKKLRWSYDENYTYDSADSPTGRMAGKYNYKGSFDPDAKYSSPSATRVLNKIYSNDTSNMNSTAKRSYKSTAGGGRGDVDEGTKKLRASGAHKSTSSPEPLSPRVHKNGAAYVNEVLAIDPYEEKMVNMYAKGFAQFF